MLKFPGIGALKEFAWLCSMLQRHPALSYLSATPAADVATDDVDQLQVPPTCKHFYPALKQHRPSRARHD